MVRRRDGESSTITLEMASNDEAISIGVEFDEEYQSLVLTTPSSIPWGGVLTSPCLSIRATVWVPEGGLLDSFNIETVHLAISLLDNLSIRLGSTRLTSVVGKIAAATTGDDNNGRLMQDGAPGFFVFNSRAIEVNTISASIDGSWPLNDFLRLKSVSGSITASIEPKAALKENPKPAELVLESVSGTIKFREPIDKARKAFAQRQTVLKAEDIIPPRDYRVGVQTTSGDIEGAVAFTYVAQFESMSGFTNVELLPVLPSELAANSPAINIKTETTSSDTTVKVVEPIWADILDSSGRYADSPLSPTAGGKNRKGESFPVGDKDPYTFLPPSSSSRVAGGGAVGQSTAQQRQKAGNLLGVLRSSHHSTSGTIKLEYPAAWVGDIRLRTLSGELGVTGKDVRIIKSGRQFPGVENVIIAEKGPQSKKGVSVVSAWSTSATIKLSFPE